MNILHLTLHNTHVGSFTALHSLFDHTQFDSTHPTTTDASITSVQFPHSHRHARTHARPPVRTAPTMTIITANHQPPSKLAVPSVSTAQPVRSIGVAAMEETSATDHHLVCSGPFASLAILVNILFHSYAWLTLFVYQPDQRPVLGRLVIYSLSAYGLWCGLMLLMQRVKVERPPLDVFASRPVAEIDDNMKMARSLASLFHLSVGVAIVGLFSYVMIVFPQLQSAVCSSGRIAMPLIWLMVHVSRLLVVGILSECEWCFFVCLIHERISRLRCSSSTYVNCSSEVNIT